MKKSALLKLIFSVLLGCGCGAFAQNFAAANPVEECSKELLIAYFPENFVTETLKKNNIPQDKWAAINKDLAEKEKDVVKIVEEKAEKMSPNPLKDPQQRQAAVKLFRDTLFQVFSDVLKKYGVTDDKQLQAMLDDVQQQKAKRFAECMQKHRDQIQQQQGRPQGQSRLQSDSDDKKTADNDNKGSNNNDDSDED